MKYDICILRSFINCMKSRAAGYWTQDAEEAIPRIEALLDEKDSRLADQLSDERSKSAKLLEALEKIRNEGTYKGVDGRSMVDNKLIEGKWTHSRAASIARQAIAEYKGEL